MRSCFFWLEFLTNNVEMAEDATNIEHQSDVEKKSASR
jgi:hypothetical protein